MSEFQGRHILITGASTGIGLATAMLLARRGAKVFLSRVPPRNSPRRPAPSWPKAERRPAARRMCRIAPRCVPTIDRAESTFGPIDGLFANAGIGGRFAPLGSYDDDIFDAVIRTNLSSVYWAIKQVLPGMIERRRGSIVVTGSLASERGMANNAAYVASKHGVLGLARAAALEAAPHQVRVNCVLPGLIETPMLLQLDPKAPPQVIRDLLGKGVPMGHIGTAQELAEMACFLLSDRASHITAQAIAVDGGILGTHSTR